MRKMKCNGRRNVEEYEQKAHEPYRSPEKPLLIDKHI